MSKLTFGEAVERMKRGFKVARDGWNGKNQWVALQVPDKNSKMTLPYMYLRTTDGNLVPWTPSQTDSVSEDWSVVEESK